MFRNKNMCAKSVNFAQVRVANICHCKDHQDEETRFYCKDCNVHICDECVQSIHKIHDFKSFKNVIKEFKDTEGEALDQLCSVDSPEEIEKGRTEMETALKKEITRCNAQAEKLVNKINQIRDQKEQEIQKMIETNEIASQQQSFSNERFIEPSRKLKQLISESGRTNDREAVSLIMRLKDVLKITPDKRLEHTVFTPKFIAAEIDDNVIEKLFGELEIKKESMREFISNRMK